MSPYDPNETYAAQNCCFARKRGEQRPVLLSVSSMTLFAFLFIADSERLEHKEMCREDALDCGRNRHAAGFPGAGNTN
jgi:hypothetical protein